MSPFGTHIGDHRGLYALIISALRFGQGLKGTTASNKALMIVIHRSSFPSFWV